MKSTTKTSEPIICYHCGELCEEDSLRFEEKPFCCSGCKWVYEILDEHELNTYYCLEDRPGISFKNKKERGRFSFLDDEAVVDKLAHFRNRGKVSLSLYLPNIHCTSCVWLLENLYKLNAGITKSSVNFLRRELSLAYNENQTSLRAVVELLASIGYEPELRMDKLEKSAAESPDRRLWLKLGVAGFAFGNIMLFSFPEYLSGSTLNNDGYFHIIFGALNIALALPVLLYSSSDYLKSAWAAIKQRGINLDVPISLGILALFLRSLYEILGGVGAGYMDSFTGLVFFLLVGRVIQKKTYERLSFDRDYKSYLPISVTTFTDEGEEKSLSIDKLETGMQMLVRNRELVPADAELVSTRCFIDYSFITGEADPVKVEQGEIVYAGGRIVGSSARMKTTKKVSNSYLTELWNNAVFDDSAQRKNMSSLADRISPHFTLAVLGIASISAVLWWPYSSTTAVTVFTSVLIIACPCALALSTPFTLGSALNIFSQNGFFVKGIEVIERLANAGSIVFDKTGTLTKADNAELRYSGRALSESEISLIKSVCRESVHPLSQKITSGLNGAPLVGVSEFQEVINNGISAYANGHAVALGSKNYVQGFIGDSRLQTLEGADGASVVHVVIDRKWIGRFEIDNAYRNGIKELLGRFKDRFSTFLLSGDNETQRSEFSPYFDSDALRFNQQPQQKLDFIKELQQKEGSVIMVGDGLNDAGALKQSDFGIALTDDVHSFTPACDAIMDGESLSKLNTMIDFSQSSMAIIKASFALSLLYNMIGLGFAVAGHLSPLVAAVLMPLSSISIMIFTTAGTFITAKKMGLRTWR